MSPSIDTDYLVLGTGAGGMAIADTLLTHTDATITLVDRRHAPGGHWLDAYPFVRLHQPSSVYGVASLPLGTGAKDRSGLNAGLYETASADELRVHFAQAMQQHFLPTGRVQHLPCSDYAQAPDGRHLITHRLSGAVQEVRVRRKLVDTAYLEGRVPATSPPPFEVASGVRCVPAGEVVHLREPPQRYVIVGTGKTALDTCVWLLSNGVPADAIQWIRPRESWWLNRRLHQPGDGLPEFLAAVGLQLKAMAQASSVDDAFARLEAGGLFMRIDPTVAPTMCRGGMVSEPELALLRQVKNVVRLGHVRRIQRERIVLEHGTVPTTPGTLHVHCAALGLARPPLRPVFEPGRLTVQPLFWGFFCFQAALLGVVEATLADDAEKNRLCPPIHYWDTPRDYLSAYLALMAHDRARAAHPTIYAWAQTTRLNPLAGLGAYREHPLVAQAKEEIKRYGAAAGTNLVALLQ
jgi:hypothetical protein